MVRTAMGEDAVILATAPSPSGRGVRVTAATDQDSPENQPGAFAEADNIAELFNGKGPQIDEQHSHLREMAKILLFHSSPDYLVDKLLETARYLEFNDVKSALEKALAVSFTFSPLDLKHAAGQRFMMVGPPGTGKTISVAKMAAVLSMGGHPLTVITTDDKRAGGVEQLAAFTDILDLELQIAASPADLLRLLSQSPEDNCVLIDSAGVNPYLPEELKSVLNLVEASNAEPLLAVAAGGDVSEAEDIARAFNGVGVRRAIITRTDAARRFGSVLASVTMAGLAFSHISTSPKVVAGLEEASPALLTDLLIRNYKNSLA